MRYSIRSGRTERLIGTEWHEARAAARDKRVQATMSYTPEPRIYRIIRFRFSGRRRTIRNNVTLTEAQAHCEREDTSSHSTGPGAWFDGYDYMKGCRPREEVKP